MPWLCRLLFRQARPVPVADDMKGRDFANQKFIAIDELLKAHDGDFNLSKVGAANHQCAKQ